MPLDSMGCHRWNARRATIGTEPMSITLRRVGWVDQNTPIPLTTSCCYAAIATSNTAIKNNGKNG